MEYLKAVEIVKKIEEKYDVMSIKYKGVSVWPQFRVYIMSTLATHSEQEFSGSAVKLILSSLFFYNPLQLFKKYDVWQFNSCITRKKVGKKFVHHVSGLVPQLGYKTLQWELPIPGVRHYKKSEIEEKYIISYSWWVLLSRGLALLGKWKRIRIKNEDVIKNILSDYGIQFDYKSCVKRLIWLKRVTDFFFSISTPPKLIVVECAYTQMGMVWSAHDNGIPVVELQHGVLNAHHYAYNPTFHSDELYPDEICVYGDVEYDYFMNHSRQYAKKVSIMGMYMLECADKYFNKDIFKDYRSSYSKIVVVAGETGLEEILSTFINKIATMMPEIMFLYLPRRSEPWMKFDSDNVKYCYGVNIYEYLKWCDVHCTITSTTCLEAHYFHRPTIFLDFEKRSSNYYGNVLDGDYGGYYINTEEDCIKALKVIDNKKIKIKEIFAHNHEIRMRKILDSYLA